MFVRIPDVMLDITWIIEDRLAAMSRPHSKQDLDELKSNGVTDLVSLTELPPDIGYLAQIGIRIHRFPIPDMSVVDVRTMDGIVSKIRKEIDAGGKVAVHCGAGLGRTGLVIACYLTTQGKSGKEAIEHVRKLRPGSIETFEQEDFIQDYASRSKGPPRRRRRKR